MMCKIIIQESITRWVTKTGEVAERVLAFMQNGKTPLLPNMTGGSPKPNSHHCQDGMGKVLKLLRWLWAWIGEINFIFKSSRFDRTN
jgi:hypothetical protein